MQYKYSIFSSERIHDEFDGGERVVAREAKQEENIRAFTNNFTFIRSSKFPNIGNVACEDFDVTINGVAFGLIVQHSSREPPVFSLHVKAEF